MEGRRWRERGQAEGEDVMVEEVRLELPSARRHRDWFGKRRRTWPSFISNPLTFLLVSSRPTLRRGLCVTCSFLLKRQFPLSTFSVRGFLYSRVCMDKTSHASHVQCYCGMSQVLLLGPHCHHCWTISNFLKCAALFFPPES